MTVELQESKSHEKYSTPATYETVRTGTPEEIARYYSDELTHAQRCDSRYRMVFADGDTWESMDFLAAYATA